jgi:ParB family chromosome partitioning protein
MSSDRPKGRKANTDRVFELDPARVKPFADQPRKRFRGIAKLAQSIKTVGQVTPILVTDCDDPDYDAELVDGERRLRACLKGGMKVRVAFDAADGASRYLRSVAANFCRQDHDPVETMEAVLALRKSGASDAQIADAFGKTPSWVATYASLRKLSPPVLDEMKIAGDEKGQTRAQKRGRGRLTLSVALLLVRLPPEQQLKMLYRIQAGKMSMAQARTFVHREGLGMGVRVGKHLSSYAKFKAVRSAVENCSHVVERYLDMPGIEIGALIRTASRNEKQELSERLEKLCENLLMLSDALEGEKGR